MPIDKYYKGHGAEVMKDMIKQYGEKKGKQMFYATMKKKNEIKGKRYSGPVNIDE